MIEFGEDVPHVLLIDRADLFLPRLVAAVIHAVAERDDGGAECGEVIVGTVGEAIRPFTAPAELHHLHVRHT